MIGSLTKSKESMLGIHVERAVSSASRLDRRSIVAIARSLEDKKKMREDGKGCGGLEPSLFNKNESKPRVRLPALRLVTRGNGVNGVRISAMRRIRIRKRHGCKGQYYCYMYCYTSNTRRSLIDIDGAGQRMGT